MSTMTKRLITLLSCAALSACNIERPNDRTAENTSALTEDNPGPGSGPVDPPPEDPPVCTGTGKPPTQAQLDKAKAALKKYLNGCTGQAAVDKVLKDFDKKPMDGELNRKEMLDLIKKLGLGAYIPGAADQWCDGVMTAIDKDKNGKCTEQELLDFLKSIGLGSPDQCVRQPEDTAPRPPVLR